MSETITYRVVLGQSVTKTMHGRKHSVNKYTVGLHIKLGHSKYKGRVNKTLEFMGREPCFFISYEN
jgi:hypothetical protein